MMIAHSARRTVPALLAALLLPALLVINPVSSSGSPAWERLSTDSGGWEPAVFLDGRYGSIGPSQSFEFRFSGEGEDGEITIGPWHAGYRSARLYHRLHFPWSRVTLRGRYRTEGLRPYQAGIMVSFHGLLGRIAKRTHFLPPAATWSDFEVAETRPPEGTKSVSVALILGDPSAGRAHFSGLEVREGAVDPDLLAPLPVKTRQVPGTLFEGSGHYRIEVIDGSSWFADPEGRPFYSLGVDGPRIGEIDLVTGRGAGHYALLGEKGFNSLGGWTHLREWKRFYGEVVALAGTTPIPIFVSLESNSLDGRFAWLEDSSGHRKEEGHRFPDPFDPAFEKAYRRSVKWAVDIAGDAPWFAGWFADSEISHSELYRYVYSRHCVKAFESFLREKFPTVADLNEAWGTAFSSFGYVISERPEPALGGPMKETFLEFEREIVRRYVEVTISAIRSLDAHRLIFSNRINVGSGETYARTLDLYGRYDGIAVNLYPANAGPGLSETERLYLESVHRLTGRPLIISEWSVPAVDSGLYGTSAPTSLLPPALAPELDWSWDEAVPTQRERAAQAARITLDFFNLPFVLGSHWYTWKDFDSIRRRANRGLLRASGEPWEGLLDSLSKVHSLILGEGEKWENTPPRRDQK